MKKKIAVLALIVVAFLLGFDLGVSLPRKVHLTATKCSTGQEIDTLLPIEPLWKF